MKTDELWTIDELGAAVAAALARGYDGPPNGRVRDVPDRRTIRYYTTLGLLDPPAEMRGRTALYGRRHLLQLVAIKQLQARGRSLAEVQQALVGQPDRALERLAGPGVQGERAVGFWRAAPAPAAATATADAEPVPPEPPRSGPLETLQGVRLAEGVTLLLAPRRALDEADLESLRAAAAPLLSLLERRQVIQRPIEKEAP
jgi:DNA-binding transcriptional MerR regulator